MTRKWEIRRLNSRQKVYRSLAEQTNETHLHPFFLSHFDDKRRKKSGWPNKTRKPSWRCKKRLSVGNVSLDHQQVYLIKCKKLSLNYPQYPRQRISWTGESANRFERAVNSGKKISCTPKRLCANVNLYRLGHSRANARARTHTHTRVPCVSNREKQRAEEKARNRNRETRERERERERERRVEREGRRGSRCAVDLVGPGVKTKIEAEPADTRFLRNYGSRLVPSRAPVNQSPLRRSYIFSVNYFYSRLRA